MRLNLKKALLTGSAIIAVGSIASQANAAALVLAPATVTNTVSAADTIDVAAQAGSTTSTLTYAFVGNTTVTATGTGTTNLGAITIGANTANTNAFILGNNTLASNLIVNGDVSGDITGTVNDLTFSVLATGNTSSSTLTFKGNVSLGSGTVTLDSGTAGGVASAVFSGTTAQTVTGIINGAVAGDGVLSVTNTGGTVTFSNNVGATAVGHIGTGAATGTTTTVFNGTVGVSNASTSTGGDGIIALGQTDGGSSNTTFKAAVTTTGGITLGTAGAGVDTNVVTFDATGGSYAVAGAVSAVNATNNDSVVVSGGTGKVVTFNNDVSGNLDAITISAGTGMAATGNVAATAINLGAGSTLTTSNTKSITGAVTGAGTLAVTGATTLVGSATGLTAVTVANGNSLLIDASAANRALSASAITLTGSGALNFTPGAFATTVTGPIGAAATGNGAMTIADGNGSVSFANSVGTSALKVGALTITDGAGTNVVNASGDLQVNTITINTGDTLNLLGTTGTVSGTVDGGAAGRGAVVVGNGTAASNYTFGSAVGTTTATVGGFKVSTGSTANISKSVATTASGAGVIGFDNEGTLNVDSTANAVTISTATGLTKLNGVTNFTGTGAFSNSVTSAAGLTIDGTVTTNVLANAQTLTLGSGAVATNIGTLSNTTLNAGNQVILATTGTNTIGASGRTNTINIVKTANFDPTAQAVILATGGGTGVVNNAGTLTIGIGAGSQALVNGSTITVIDSTAAAQMSGVGTTYAAQIAAGRIVLQNTGLISLVDNGSDAADLKVKVAYKDAATVLATQANASVATSLMANTTATGNLNTARNNLLSASTAASANSVAESLSPAADGAAADASIDVTQSVFDLAGVRLAALRDGGASTGMAAGNGAYGHRVWAEGFGRTATQDRRNGTAGYDADTGGVTVGVDGITDANQLLGVAVSYANTNIDSKNANTTDTDVDTYQVSIYGQMPVIDSNTFITGMAAYGFNKNETTRHNVGAIAGLTARGDYDASQYSAQVELGRDYKNLSNGLTLTPSVGATYSYYDADSYTETGAGTANLNVNPDSLSSLDLGVGIDAKWDIANKDGSKLVPSLTAGYRYDVIGDSLDANSTFTGGGAAFTTQGVDPSRSTFTAGAGLKYVTTSNWELSARYTFDAKSEYTAHAGQVRAGYKF